MILVIEFDIIDPCTFMDRVLHALMDGQLLGSVFWYSAPSPLMWGLQPRYSWCGNSWLLVKASQTVRVSSTWLNNRHTLNRPGAAATGLMIPVNDNGSHDLGTVWHQPIGSAFEGQPGEPWHNYLIRKSCIRGCVHIWDCRLTQSLLIVILSWDPSQCDYQK